jgi:hypothetical protein
MSLWQLEEPAQRSLEEESARSLFASDDTELTVLRSTSPKSDASRLDMEVRVFVVKEPQARVAYWQLKAKRRGGRWALASRVDGGSIEGLVHLSLGGTAWRTRGASLRLEDFELRMDEGTLFTSPADVGPTALVFVGRGRVRVSPRPPAEQEQLRQFAKAPEIDRPVDWAFARILPADFDSLVDTARLEPDGDPGDRRAEAERVWRERAERSYLVDAPLPRSPWWLLPGPGDAVVDVPFGRHVLSFVVASAEHEDINLFDRDRHLEICSYPSGGRRADYSEDAGRTVDFLEHDLNVRFDPSRFELQAVHRATLRLLAPTSTLRLRLDDDFRVQSVTADDDTSLLFLRVRGQNSLVVSLGPLASREGPFTLTTRYSGRHNPAPVDQELIQVVRAPDSLSDTSPAFVDVPPLIYSNRTAWYPQPPDEDFATMTAGLETPEGWLAVTSGDLVTLRRDEGRVLAEYRLTTPGKYFTAVVGRLDDVGQRQEGEDAVRGFSGPRTRGDTQDVMPVALDLLAFYAERYGPCPYPHINLVLAEGSTPGGHSPPALLYLQERPPVLRSRRLADDPANFSDIPGFFLAHEAAHQWWGQGVAPASYRERWLSEAWAQYSAAMWIRRERGEGDFKKMMDRMARWALRSDSMGPIHLGRRLGHIEGDPRIFRAIVYDKGAWVLHMLRGLVGDDAFFSGARAFLREHRYSKAGTQGLRVALEAASGRDLSPYFERWIYDTGLPTLLWTRRTERRGPLFSTTVDVHPLLLPGPLPLQIAVSTGGGREERSVTLSPAGGSWTFETADKPSEVEINGNRGLLADVKQVRRLPPPQR